MKTLCAILGLWCVTLSGSATVRDGDTIRVNGVAVRLAGVDAEELWEPNGSAARGALMAIIAGRSVQCAPTGKRSYERIVATCAILGNPDAKGPTQLQDIGALLIARGYALDCARYSGGKYRDLEPPGVRDVLRQKPYC